MARTTRRPPRGWWDPDPEPTGRHWILTVSWRKILDWKRRVREDRDGREAGSAPDAVEGEYPFQYGTKQATLLAARPGDVLWLVCRPQYKGRKLPPTIMARLSLIAVAERAALEGLADDLAIHPASDSFGPYYAFGRRTAIRETYPPLYNAGVGLAALEFEHGPQVKLAEKLAVKPEQRPWTLAEWDRVKSDAKKGRFGRITRYTRFLRRLKRSAAVALDEYHTKAMAGGRIFVGYKHSDINRLDGPRGTGSWMQALSEMLLRNGLTTWWDRQHVRRPPKGKPLPENELSAILSDGVRQATCYVALVTEQFCDRDRRDGGSWTLEEWDDARALARAQRRDPLGRLALVFGDASYEELGDPSTGEFTLRVGVSARPTPEEIAALIGEHASSL